MTSLDQAMLRKAALFGLIAAALGGCLTFGDSSGTGEEEPTYDEPTFAVDAELTQQSCGTGQIAFESTRTFDVGLTIDAESASLEWHTHEGIANGDVDLEDGSFFITYSLTFDMRGPDDGWLPPCSIRRTDEIDGAVDDAEDPLGFEASISHRYEPLEGSDCSDLLVGEARLMERLPCAVAYDLVGELLEPPAEEGGGGAPE